MTDQYRSNRKTHCSRVRAKRFGSKARSQLCEALGTRAGKSSALLSRGIYWPRSVLEPALDLNPAQCHCGENSQQKPPLYPSAWGIPDASFITDKADGQRHDLRSEKYVLAILSLYDILKQGDTDVGHLVRLRCVMWKMAYWHPRKSHLFPLEHHPERLALLNANSDRFGVMPEIYLSSRGAAPDVLGICFLNIMVRIRSTNKVSLVAVRWRIKSALMAQVWDLFADGGSLMVSGGDGKDTKFQVMQFASSARKRTRRQTSKACKCHFAKANA